MYFWHLGLNKILWCDHSNETSSAVLLLGQVPFFFSIFYKMKCRVFFFNFSVWYSLELKGYSDYH